MSAAAELMARYRAAAMAHDFDGALALVADDAVLHVPGRSGFAGTHRGRAAFTAYLRAVLDHAGDDLELEVIDTLVSEDRVALLVRERLGAVTIRRANVYRVAGGKIVEIHIFEHDQEAVDRLMADVPVPPELRAAG